MASSKANRSAFIASLIKFLNKWSFQGVDIDWEWPGAVNRGGDPEVDMRNQIDLVVELRESLSDHGLSVVLPVQYEYLKNMNPKALEAQVDFFNLLAYDLHGVNSLLPVLLKLVLMYFSHGMLPFLVMAHLLSHTPI